MRGVVIAGLAAAWTGAAPPAFATSDRDAFVADVLVATFYHELGHALIDLHDLPVLGREEDAADGLAALMIDAAWEGETAEAMLRHAALAWRLSDARATAEGEVPTYWDVHALDLQRHYNQVCLFFGADPDGRVAFARDLGLPDERAEGCAEEYDQAADGWAVALDAMEKAAPGRLMFDPAPPTAGDPLDSLLAEEVDAVNAAWRLPADLTVGWEECGEPNAFYDPGAVAIVLCRELADDLGALWDDRARLLP